MSIDFESVVTVAQREASLAVRSTSVIVVFLLSLIGTAGLMIYLGGEMDPGGGLGTATELRAVSIVVTTMLVTVLFISIMMVGTMVGGSIAQEKDRRVIEILLSSVRAEELYIGKLLGYGAVGVVQLLALSLVSVISLWARGAVAWNAMPWSSLLMVILFFICGFFLFASLFSMAGALVSRTEDYGAAQLVPLLVLVACLALPMFGIASLGATWMEILAWVPPTSVGIASLHFAAGNMELIPVLGSWMILLVATMIFIFLGGKVFRRTVLS